MFKYDVWRHRDVEDERTIWNQAFSEKIIAVIEPNYELNLINIDIAECYGGT